MYSEEILCVPRNDGNVVDDGQGSDRQILSAFGLLSSPGRNPKKSQLGRQRHLSVQFCSVSRHIYRDKPLVFDDSTKPSLKAIALVGARISQSFNATVNFKVGTERNDQRMGGLKADPSLQSPMGALPGQLTQHIRVENVRHYQCPLCSGRLRQSYRDIAPPHERGNLDKVE